VTLEADPDVGKGTVLNVPYTVTDDEHPPVDGTLKVEVVASTRPLARAVEDVVDDAHQGRPVSVPVLANDSNPFAERAPLEIVGQPIIETGRGGTVVDGDKVVVTPDASFIGTMVVRYRIQDATQDPDRQVEGRIRINVLGRPDAPAMPQVEEVRSETVVLSWTPPANNGAEITSYTVKSDKGDTFECATTTCTLDGLTNNVTYTFTVVANNAVGASDPSPPSAEARPDQRPDPPAAPNLEFGDSSLVVTWENARYSDRSPIESVNLEISPAPANGQTQKVGVTSNRIVWEGLTNGTAYEVRVQAVNQAPEPSDWGAWSTPEIPAAPPEAPAAPAASRVDDPAGGSVHVTWTAPANNGDTIKTYHVDEFKNGTKTRTLETAETSITTSGLDDSSTYTYAVTAENKAGKGGTSPQSNPVIPYGKPGAPGTPQASLGSNTSGQADVSWAAADANGNPVTYTVQNDKGASRTTTATSMTFTGLNNGTEYRFRVQACNAAGCSVWTAWSNAVKPYTVPGTPGVTWHKSSATDGYFTVRGPGDNGGRAVQKIEWKLTGSEAKDGSRTSWPFDIGVSGGYGKSYTLQARACNQAGCGSWASASGKTDPPPNPRAWVTRGAGTGVRSGCSSGNCNWFVVNTQDFPAGSHRVECWSGSNPAYSGGWHNIIQGSDGKIWTTPGGPGFNVNLPANGEVRLDCFYGYPGTQVAVVIDGKRYEARTW
jgi:hypothetical protein